MLGHYDSTNGYADFKNSATLLTIARWLRLLCGDSLHDTTNLPWLTPYKSTNVLMTSSGHHTSTSSNYEAASSANNAAAAASSANNAAAAASSANNAAAAASSATTTAAASSATTAAASSATTTAETDARSAQIPSVLSGQPTTAVSTGLSAVSSGLSAETHPLLAASQQGDCTPTSAVRGAGDATAAVSSGQPTIAVSTGLSAVSSGLSAVPYGHTDTHQLFAASQQEDCTSHSAVSSAVTQSADSSANLSAAVSTGLSAVSSANLSAVLKQGDCPPADAGSSVNAAQEQNSLTRPDQTAANSLAAAAATAQLDNDLLSGSQERCPPADAGSSAYATGKQNTTAAAQNAQDLAAAQQNTDSLAAAAATAQNNDYLSLGSQQGDCSAADTGRSAQDTIAAAKYIQNHAAVPMNPITSSKPAHFQAAISLAATPTRFTTINFGSIIGLSLFRFKFSVYDLKDSGIKFGMVPLLLFIFQGPSSNARTISR